MQSAPTVANHPDLLDAAQSGRLPAPLESEIRKIYRRSPLYTQRFPLHSEPIQWGCYREIPALSKKEIVERGHRAFFEDYAVIERGLASQKFEYESTGGTTQSPMTVIMEDGWWNAQTARAYRAHPLLAPYADRPYRKCVLAPVGCSSNICPYEDHPFPHRYFDGTVYLNLTSDPFVFPESEWDRIVTEVQAVQPEVIEGEPVYLSLLARAVQKRGVKVPSVKVVILTYGKASLQHAKRIAEVFPAPQVDLYGSTVPADFACWHYSLVQTSENRWDFHYVADHVAPKSLEPALAEVLGFGARVVAFRRRFIAPAASGKFALLKPLAK